MKRKALYLFIKQLKADFAFLQDSHSNFKDTNFWKSGAMIFGFHMELNTLLGLHSEGEILQALCDRQVIMSFWLVGEET